ncbi:MAG: biopolymer transporter ExbD [Kiritimatiellaeota bacterium]|nr:biopolymer transporter ExbD [Kiritimatiellota bacterium]
MAHINLKTKGNVQTMAEINMVPFIDIVLVLLIIFMVMTPVLVKMQERDIQVSLPTDAQNQTLSSLDVITINVRRNGSYVMHGKQVTLEEMMQSVTAAVKANASQKVLIRGDQEALHGYVAKAVSLCKHAGVKEAKIGYQVPE